MEHFTPLASLIGGSLIGLSASAMLVFNGKIAGISGIIGGLVIPKANDTLWRAAFVAGLLTGGFILRLLAPQAFDFGIVRSGGALVLAGFMVGWVRVWAMDAPVGMGSVVSVGFLCARSSPP